MNLTVLLASTVVASAVAGSLAYQAGVASSFKDFQKRLDRQVEEVNRLNGELAKREQEFTRDANVIANQYAQELQRQQAANTVTTGRLYSGVSRMRVNVTSCGEAAQPGSATDSNGTHDRASGQFEGTPGSTYATLEPSTAIELFSIAADGDTAVVQLTELQKYTRLLYDVCSKPVQ